MTDCHQEEEEAGFERFVETEAPQATPSAEIDGTSDDEDYGFVFHRSSESPLERSCDETGGTLVTSADRGQKSNDDSHKATPTSGEALHGVAHDVANASSSTDLVEEESDDEGFKFQPMEIARFEKSLSPRQEESSDNNEDFAFQAAATAPITTTAPTRQVPATPFITAPLMTTPPPVAAPSAFASHTAFVPPPGSIAPPPGAFRSVSNISPSVSPPLLWKAPAPTTTLGQFSEVPAEAQSKVVMDVSATVKNHVQELIKTLWPSDSSSEGLLIEDRDGEPHLTELETAMNPFRERIPSTLTNYAASPTSHSAAEVLDRSDEFNCGSGAGSERVALARHVFDWHTSSMRSAYIADLTSWIRITRQTVDPRFMSGKAESDPSEVGDHVEVSVLALVVTHSECFKHFRGSSLRSCSSPFTLQ
eukprot:GHVN01095395.1.p1 GENE.GHVN01095395.1~~GHVN01095395.1.p1  ORF type:complete len:420 (+),score=62.83 GHVN01095395.1:71-1330(+)